MLRKQGLAAPVSARPDLPERSPALAVRRNRRTFTLADQVNLLVSAREADPDRGFLGRTMALCSLPRSNPGNRHQYKRVNGPYKLGMTAGLDNKLPYGNFPRLLLAWVSTEAVRTQSRVLVLEDSLSDFMRALGVYSAGGGNASIKLRNQMRRLFNAHVQLVYEDEHGEASVSSSVTDSTELWWNVRKPGERSLWDSKIELSEKFFQEIIRHPVPLDMNILKSLKRSTLGLDLYLWTAYRTFALRAPLRLSWRQVYRQFGAHPDKSSDNNTVQAFRYKVLRELKKIKLAWPGLNYTTGRGVLILHPSTPAIPPSEQHQLAS